MWGGTRAGSGIGFGAGFRAGLRAGFRGWGSSTRKCAPGVSGLGSSNVIRPPCRSVTQRAIARPSPVPPPPGSRRVPNRSKTRSRSSGAIPSPWSETSITTPPGPAAAVTRTAPPDGLCRAALSSRLARSWCRRALSACTSRPGGSTYTSTGRVRPPVRSSATHSSTRSLSATSVRSRDTTPASSRERSSRSRTRSLSRSAWPRATRTVAGSATVTPSSRFSSTATRAVNGVRSSWETVATSSRRWRSTVARSAAIRLKVRASSPTSSVEVVCTRTE